MMFFLLSPRANFTAICLIFSYQSVLKEGRLLTGSPYPLLSMVQLLKTLQKLHGQVAFVQVLLQVMKELLAQLHLLVLLLIIMYLHSSLILPIINNFI